MTGDRTVTIGKTSGKGVPYYVGEISGKDILSKTRSSETASSVKKISNGNGVTHEAANGRGVNDEDRPSLLLFSAYSAGLSTPRSTPSASTQRTAVPRYTTWRTR